MKIRNLQIDHNEKTFTLFESPIGGNVVVQYDGMDIAFMAPTQSDMLEAWEAIVSYAGPGPEDAFPKFCVAVKLVADAGL
jgi:hypothetical protein